MSTFHNPYAFVPAPRRDVARDDGPPPAQGVLRPGHWTGHLRLRLTATTPLLVTEQRRDTQGVVTRSTRSIGGTVALPATSVKGMLRTEFETVTNSRFGVFDPHRDRLGHRIGTARGSSAYLVPCRVVVDGDGTALQPLHGRGTGMRVAGRDALPAAWVPYRGRNAVPTGSLAHGDRVWAWSILIRRDRWDRKQARWCDAFLYWRVVSMRAEQHPAPVVVAGPHGSTVDGRKRHVVVDATPVELVGWYARTNHNIDTKYNERIFFDAAETRGERLAPTWELTDDLRSQWRQLLESYRAASAVQGPEVAGGEPSRHLDPTVMAELRDLPVGTLCYADLDRGELPRHLYPVSLSRRLFDVPPRTLAQDTGLAPAAHHGELSHADRLFGWVPERRDDTRPRADTAPVRGRVRFGPVETVSARTERVDRWLAVLGQPRPTQDLFYAAADDRGTPLRKDDRGTPSRRDDRGAPPRKDGPETIGYREGEGLRGRKVYPHQPAAFGPGPERPWLHEGTGENSTMQTAKLRDVVAAGAVFEMDLHVEDVDDDELGALLWVLCGPGSSDPAARRHKLGGGKPLGFGSVTVEVLWPASQVRDTRAWCAYFALDDEPAGAVLDETSARERAATAHAAAPPRVARAYERALAGFDAATPVRYPADPKDPSSQTERYRWFVANRGVNGRSLPLPELGGPGLPDDPTRPREGRW